MGREISGHSFSQNDFDDFADRLGRETRLLEEWLHAGRFVDGSAVAGYELEAWLIGADLYPAPINEQFLASLNSDYVVPELSRFNVEFNVEPEALQGAMLKHMRIRLSDLWRNANRVADRLGARLAMIGILPTVREQELSLVNMSDRARYRALNEQILRMRNYQPLSLDIHGSEHIETSHWDVMLESAATSFQIHLQVDQARAARFFNAAQILSAPMVAACANSPFLFGRDLWAETRIPLFEQAVNTTDEKDPNGSPRRVTFGDRYLSDSIMEIYAENLARFPILLPDCSNEQDTVFNHVRLHNGTIWRWNRPLLGFTDKGEPTLRIEHRVVAAGPSVIDSIANAALFYGAVHALADEQSPPERRLSFDLVRQNFYTAAREGLQAELSWLDGRRGRVSELLTEVIIPMARQALIRLDLDSQDVKENLDILEARVNSGQNGASWQRAFHKQHACDMQGLTGAYLERQDSGQPVHEWEM